MLASKKADPQANLPEGQSHQTRGDAAALVNVSPRMIDKAEKVIEQGTPELVTAVERWVFVPTLCCCPATSLEGRGRGAVFVR